MAGETWRVTVDGDVEITVSIIEGTPSARGWVAVAQTVLPGALLLDRGTAAVRVVSGPHAGSGARAWVSVDDRRVTFTGLSPFEVPVAP